MRRFKNILVVAEQDNGQTRSLLNTAIDLARNNGAALTVAAVVDEIPKRRRFLQRGNRRIDLQDLMIESKTAELKEATPQTDLPVHYDVMSGIPYLKIIERVNIYGHDLVLTVPMPAIRKVGLGSSSTTMHLLRKCPVPVWVHSPLATTADALLVAIGPLGDATFDLNIRLLELASSLARLSDSELHVVHAWRLEGETMLKSPRLAYSTDEIDEMGREIRETAELSVQALLDELGEAGRGARIHVRKGHAGDVIPDVIDQVNPSAIVMGTVARSGIPGLIIGNTAERVLVAADRSVLAVKPNGFVSPVSTISEWDVTQMPY